MRRWIFGALATLGVTAAIAVPLMTGAPSHRATRLPSGLLVGWIRNYPTGHWVRLQQSISKTKLKAHSPTLRRVGR